MKLQLSQSLKNLFNILWLLSWILPQGNPLGIWTCEVVDEDGDEEQGEGGREEERGRGREDEESDDGEHSDEPGGNDGDGGGHGGDGDHNDDYGGDGGDHDLDSSKNFCFLLLLFFQTLVLRAEFPPP